jgi:GNAT superfamily N-acetyltransferase
MSMVSEDDVLVYRWRGDFENEEVNRLHAQAFEHPLLDIDWRAQLDRHSLGWVCARRGDQLVGFLNVAWDGGAHAFVLDTTVVSFARRAGIGSEMVYVATQQAHAAGCEWLHVDFDEHLRGFYLDACHFTETHAGLINLRTRS